MCESAVLLCRAGRTEPCEVEDIEKEPTGSDSVPLVVSECDSGLGHSLPNSSGRVSQLSNEEGPPHSHTISIPDAREPM